MLVEKLVIDAPINTIIVQKSRSWAEVIIGIAQPDPSLVGRREVLWEIRTPSCSQRAGDPVTGENIADVPRRCRPGPSGPGPPSRGWIVDELQCTVRIERVREVPLSSRTSPHGTVPVKEEKLPTFWSPSYTKK